MKFPEWKKAATAQLHRYGMSWTGTIAEVHIWLARFAHRKGISPTDFADICYNVLRGHNR